MDTSAIFSTNLEEATIQNTNFRTVIFTGNHLQLVLMSLRPGENIGIETHYHVDQFFRVEKGDGKAVINGTEVELKDGVAFVIRAGEEHDIMNKSDTEDLKLYTIYAPPNHPDGTIHTTKDDAEEDE
ncbi:cupin domain-containing protein [bacterium]|nr:MAG: cupin domain-containing protein [bacterium]